MDSTTGIVMDLSLYLSRRHCHAENGVTVNLPAAR